MPTAISRKPKETLAIHRGVPFCRTNAGIVLLISALILIPCFWCPHIEAGDLASHTYNAWLAQVAAKGQAPGIYVAPQWNNILFDVSVSYLGNRLGFPMSERIVVSVAVLVLFWGVFSFLAVVTNKPPWLFTPCIAILAYGYVFSMGFMNYYLSIGLASFALAILWRGGVGNWICAVPVGILALVAHPLGFVWLIGTAAYVWTWRRVPGRWRVVLPISVAALVLSVHVYVVRHPLLRASWRQDHFYLRNGSDQMIFYGHRYATLAFAAVGWGLLCFAVDVGFRLRNREATWQPLRLTVELYAVALLVTAVIPENVRTNLYPSWIGLLVSRLTLISAILGLAILNSGPGRRWFFAGFAACAAVFFLFLFQDMRNLNRLENNADRIVAALPLGARIVPVVNAPSDWRAMFVFHAVERACVGHCFSYANYEPSSQQFRVRVKPGSNIVMSSSDDAEAVATGDYVVRESDPPLTAIYQCDDSDFTKLCVVPLHPGETVETPLLENGDH